MSYNTSMNWVYIPLSSLGVKSGGLHKKQGGLLNRPKCSQNVPIYAYLTILYSCHPLHDILYQDVKIIAIDQVACVMESESC